LLPFVTLALLWALLIFLRLSLVCKRLTYPALTLVRDQVILVIRIRITDFLKISGADLLGDTLLGR
jgi:hypothetical protein